MELIADALIETLIDSLKILPFLFVTYVFMEYLEKKAEHGQTRLLGKAGRFGPLIGGVLGIIPQCGFAAAASGLYAGRVISAGTLIAIFLSTSDEMLPLMMAGNLGASKILKILILKALIGAICGFAVDFCVHAIRRAHSEKETDDLRIDEMCEREHCHCGDEEGGGIIKSALIHTRNIFIFVVIITLALNLIMAFFGEEALSELLGSHAVLSHALFALVGLIPNCAASVVITSLYLDGIITAGAMMSGLLSGAGIGLMVLYRVNPDLKENLRLTAALFAFALICGTLIDATSIWL